MLIQDVEVIWQCLFPKQSRTCYVISIKTKESLMVRDVGSQSNQYWRKFAYEGARDFSGETWLLKILEGSTQKRIEYCKKNDGFFCYLRPTQGYSGGIPIVPELMGYVLIPRNWKR